MRHTAVFLALLLAMPLVCVGVSAEESEGSVLIDMGNGTTYWYDFNTQKSLKDLTSDAVSEYGLTVKYSGEKPTEIGGMKEHSVGTQLCGWILYVWGGKEWIPSEPSSYVSGSFAWGFYPDNSIIPAETPDSRTAWIMHRGDSESSGNSDSYGTVNAVAPMEWYRTYTAGYVDSAIVTAGDYLYHTTGGEYGASGSDRNPWVYCLNRFTGEIVWEFMMTYGQGYEVTSPLVVGDMLIVTATNWNVYCFDRFTGEALYTLSLKPDYPMDSDGNIVWKGRTFYTGGTTPIYDSGAVYFGTADGHILSYAVSRDRGFEILWDYNPDASVTDGKYTGTKGCFYYHAPVITDVDGTRVLFMGSYEGYIHALDASTGKELWTERMVNYGDDNIPHKGTPGSVAGISVAPGNRLIVSCNDGGLSPQDGFTVCVDARTGKGPEGSDCYWKSETILGGPVVVSDGFYAYGQQSEHSEGTVYNAVCKYDLDGNVIWSSSEYGAVKAALTLADGVLYTVDYSAGRFWPEGGGVTAISAEDGSEIWRLRLSPYADDSYSMVSATVIDGRIYVGNDYGAVYCISEIAGPEFGDGGEIKLGNGFLHWSWIVLILAVFACLLFLWRYY